MIRDPSDGSVKEPAYIAQTGEPMSWEERKLWIGARLQDGDARGAKFFRASVHPEIIDLTLLEGWEEKPESYGEPRWQMTSEKPR